MRVQVLWLKSRSSEVWLERRTSYTRSTGVMSMVRPHERGQAGLSRLLCTRQGCVSSANFSAGDALEDSVSSAAGLERMVL